MAHRLHTVSRTEMHPLPVIQTVETNPAGVSSPVSVPRAWMEHQPHPSFEKGRVSQKLWSKVIYHYRLFPRLVVSHYRVLNHRRRFLMMTRSTLQVMVIVLSLLASLGTGIVTARMPLATSAPLATKCFLFCNAPVARSYTPPRYLALGSLKDEERYRFRS